MSAGTNPIDALIAQAMMQQIAGAGGSSTPSSPSSGMPGGMPVGPGGQGSQGPSDSTSLQLSRELSSLRTADPGAMLQALNEMKQLVVTIINHTAMSLPGVARHIAKALGPIESAVKEAQQAAATASVVSPPIQSSALPASVSPQDAFAGFTPGGR